MARQPAGPVQINRGNYLGSKVIAHFPLRGGIDRSTNNDLVVLGGAVYGTNGRSALIGSGTGGMQVALDLSAFGQLTYAFSYFNPATLSNDGMTLEYSDNYNNHSGTFVCLIDDSTTDGAEAGWHHDINGSYCTFSFPKPTPGVWHRIFVSMDLALAASDPLALRVWIDNSLAPLTAIAASATANATRTFGNYPLYALSRAAASLNASQQMENMTFFKGALGPAEAAADFANPYQILQPTRSPFDAAVFALTAYVPPAPPPAPAPPDVQSGGGGAEEADHEGFMAAQGRIGRQMYGTKAPGVPWRDPITNPEPAPTQPITKAPGPAKRAPAVGGLATVMPAPPPPEVQEPADDEEEEALAMQIIIGLLDD